MGLPAEFQPLVFVAGIAIASWFLMRQIGRQQETYRKESRRFRSEATSSPSNATAANSGVFLNHAPDEITRWSVELLDQVRSWEGELQTKAAVLQSLVQMAREESERLEARIEQTRTRELPNDPISTSKESEFSTSPYAASQREAASANELIDRSLLLRSLQLSEQGFSMTEIAQRIGCSVADTEFLLSLQKWEKSPSP
ncbi:MAG: hypothetical protein RLY14_2992 [Planctomycetota bacterium]|jgi:hypothetical protein